MPKLRTAILCGGAGTRLWPLSRANAPKQFHSLVSTRSLLSETVSRAAQIPDAGRQLIVTAEAFGVAVGEHAGAAGVSDIDVILEPAPRNTAAAAALAAFAASEDGPNTIIAILPSDHHIDDDAGFLAAIADARALAEDGAIVTLGILPDAPHTGYGYIQRGQPMGAGFKVSRFVEKPDAETAKSLFEDGSYYWNAGIFLFRCDVFLRELEAFRPDILAAARAAWDGAQRTPSGILAEPAAWGACPSDSIDYAVAEKTSHAAVVPADFGWNDVGSWSSLRDLATRDAQGNATFGDVRTFGAEGCYVRATSKHVSVIGATDLIIVETADAVLIVHKDATQQVKSAAEAFKRSSQIVTE